MEDGPTVGEVVERVRKVVLPILEQACERAERRDLLAKLHKFLEESSPTELLYSLHDVWRFEPKAFDSKEALVAHIRQHADDPTILEVYNAMDDRERSVSWSSLRLLLTMAQRVC